MYELTSNLRKVCPIDLAIGDIIFVHNPVKLHDSYVSKDLRGPGLILDIKIRESVMSYNNDAREIIVAFGDNTNPITFWGTMWNFYKM